MRRTPSAAALALVLLAGCRDGPQAITAPVDPTGISGQREVASKAALFAVWDILDDPFVRDLVEGLGADRDAYQQTTWT
ncbi:MAG TPA: hypothetical protein EYQ64_11365 [Gemmatimonadetes bacterium]|jgi:hypothetical protein|nr:hypothetical protein [Gemmatimonadota bacterium]